MSDYGQRLRQQATYASDDRAVEREYFTTERYVRLLEPSQEFMKVITKGAACLSLTQQLVAPEKIICSYLDINFRGPAQTGETGEKNILALRIAQKLRQEFDSQGDNYMIENVKTMCPKCGGTVIARIGFVPFYDEEEDTLLPVHGPEPIGYDMECDCILDEDETEELRQLTLDAVEDQT